MFLKYFKKNSKEKVTKDKRLFLVVKRQEVLKILQLHKTFHYLQITLFFSGQEHLMFIAPTNQAYKVHSWAILKGVVTFSCPEQQDT